MVRLQMKARTEPGVGFLAWFPGPSSLLLGGGKAGLKINVSPEDASAWQNHVALFKTQ